MGSSPGGGLIKQPYLLNHANYPATYANNLRVSGREFQVTANAQCTGLRLKASAISQVDIRLWRVSDTSLLASRSNIPVVVGDNEVEFSTPVVLSTVETYRIVARTNDDPVTIMINQVASLHPDGPIVILTANSFVYRDGDVYPLTVVATWSSSIEPTIYA